MKVYEALIGVERLGLDSAPIIYYVEGNYDFHSLCSPFFEAIANGTLEAFTSTITLPETLVHPFRNNDNSRITAFRNLLLHTKGIATTPLSVAIADRSARLRADYNLRTPDAVQLATALHTSCDSFLTNDLRLRSVSELKIIVLSELQL